ncbi:kelch-like protein 10 isoform X3 [Diabrotica virgifera virgifera]|uniref:Kelch-like protein diablo n=2 Tax=Diabrotica virgifera virgifera TaxID=50390 RepID=A0ABM5L7N2_DIAVI|nr:kelch-like protein 10 isoform X3 [Diabrotica virgifera virgifera]
MERTHRKKLMARFSNPKLLAKISAPGTTKKRKITPSFLSHFRVRNSFQASIFDFPPVWTELRRNAQLCDGIVTCGDGREFKIHRAILAAVSPYFKALFTNSINKDHNEVTEAKIMIPSSMFEIILDYAYTGSCTINKSNVKELLKFADQYQLLDVLQMCCNYLIDEICPANCLETMKFASRYFCKELMKVGKLYITRNFPMPRVPHEVIFAIGGWCEGSPTNFVETYDCKADKWLFCCDTDTSPRAYHGLCTLNGLIYMIGGFDGTEYFNSVKCFDPVHHEWSQRSCMYFPRCYVSVVVHRGLIYAMGGFNGRLRMNSAERYDPEKNQWELIPPMQKARSDAGAAAVRDKIYIVGGFNGSDVMSSVEVYDTLTRQWSFIQKMSSPRSGVTLITLRNVMYAIGGFNGSTRLSSCEKFDPDILRGWTSIAHMRTPRSNFACVILDGFIVVIGGFNDTGNTGSTTVDLVEYLDADANEWYDAASMSVSRSALSACVVKGLPNTIDYTFLRTEMFMPEIFCNKE